MASSTPHTIVLKTADGSGFSARVEESWIADAATTIQPGQLLERDNATEVSEHSTAGGDRAGCMVALENDYDDTGGTTAAIDANYAVGDTVRVIFAQPGDLLYMWLANGENASIGSPLESNGSGDLQVHTPQAVDEDGTATYTIYTDNVVGYAEEALNNSTGSPARLRVRIA